MFCKCAQVPGYLLKHLAHDRFATPLKPIYPPGSSRGRFFLRFGLRLCTMSEGREAEWCGTMGRIPGQSLRQSAQGEVNELQW